MSSGKHSNLKTIEDTYDTPEHINTTPTSAPSKRLKKIYPSYDKVFLGSLISDQIGLDTIKSQCAHFSTWINKLENLTLQP